MSAETLQISKVLDQASLQLCEMDTPRLDAEVILASIMKKDRVWLQTWPEKKLTSQQLEEFIHHINKRAAHYPVSYITGVQEFWSREFYVNKSVLIPRPETECLIEIIFEKILMDKAKILDLGTGSGCIGITIALENPQWTIQAVDVDKDALAVAHENAKNHAVNNIRFYSGSWFFPVKGQRFDVVVSNPPYIEAADDHVRKDDVQYEPVNALVSGDDGLLAIREIIAAAPAHMNNNAMLLLEHGWNQAGAVRGLLKDSGFENVNSEKDLQGHERVSYGVWKAVV